MFAGAVASSVEVESLYSRGSSQPFRSVLAKAFCKTSRQKAPVGFAVNAPSNIRLSSVSLEDIRIVNGLVGQDTNDVVLQSRAAELHYHRLSRRLEVVVAQ